MQINLNKFNRLLVKHHLWFWIWMFIALIGSCKALISNGFNNFNIFRGVFWHTIEKLSLYAEYPLEYADVNHYGVFFSAVIAPFAVLPAYLGLPLWLFTNVFLLFFAVSKLDLSPQHKGFIYLIASHELLGAIMMQQFNIGVTALIVLTFTMVEKGKNKWATLFIVIATLTKIYGLVGLAFFFFSKNKISFVLWFVFWMVVLFALPMVYTSPQYVILQYQQWATQLSVKNGLNLFARLQNMGFVGFVRKTTMGTYPDWIIILPALVLFALPYLRLKQYKNVAFRMLFLASTLMFIVLFSSGTEHSGYIIAYIAIPIWYVLSPDRNSRINLIIFIIAIIGTFMVSDLMPRYFRKEWVYPYALKSLPVMLVWLKLIYDLSFGNFTSKSDEVLTFLPPKK